ncbi:MAG TPA: hypothetical protein VME41_17375 [Stellaceae bacterium]|nr:hypothetical protein [Stellaceae bacterium]
MRSKSLIVAPIVSFALSLATTLHAVASPVTYTFTPDASLTFEDGNTEDLVGSFTIDTTATTPIISSDITVNGPSPESTFYLVAEVDPSKLELSYYNFATTTGTILYLQFTTPLTGPAASLEISQPWTQYDSTTGIELVIHQEVATGGVEPLISPVPSSVPEPSSFILLAPALGLFLVTRWASRASTRVPPRRLAGA